MPLGNALDKCGDYPLLVLCPKGVVERQAKESTTHLISYRALGSTSANRRPPSEECNGT